MRNIIINVEGLYNLCSARVRPLSREGRLSCHISCDTGSMSSHLLWHGVIHVFMVNNTNFVTFNDMQMVLMIYSNLDSYGNIRGFIKQNPISLTVVDIIWSLFNKRYCWFYWTYSRLLSKSYATHFAVIFVKLIQFITQQNVEFWRKKIHMLPNIFKQVNYPISKLFCTVDPLGGSVG